MEKKLPSSALLSAFCAAAILAAATLSAAQATDKTTWVDIKNWDTAYLYKGWSAEELLDEEVYGRNGNEIGEVEDFFIGPDGKIQKVIVEGGGFLDIGDSHLGVPWDQVTRNGTSSITVPIEEGNLDEFGVFENVDDMAAKPKNFRLSQLLGDYVTADGVGYGNVEDAIFSEDGKLQAIVANPAYSYGYEPGYYALPYETDYDPYGPYYAVPYGIQELKDLRPFDYSQYD